MTDTRHLDTALEIFKSGKGKRAKGTTFTLTLQSIDPEQQHFTGTLQGPRGKTIETLQGGRDEILAKVNAKVARTPGATLTVFE